MYRKVLSLQELEDIISDPDFTNAEKIDVVVLPPEPDSLTDEDEADDDLLGTVEVNDVPGELVIECRSSNNIQSFDNEQEPSNILMRNNDEVKTI